MVLEDCGYCFGLAEEICLDGMDIQNGVARGKYWCINNCEPAHHRYYYYQLRISSNLSKPYSVFMSKGSYRHVIPRVHFPRNLYSPEANGFAPPKSRYH